MTATDEQAASPVADAAVRVKEPETAVPVTAPVTAEAGLPTVAARLRVLNDRLAGAEHRLHAGKNVRVGHSFENDIVLRGKDTAGLALELHVGPDVTILKMLTGSIAVLGRELVAGEEMPLPPYLPVKLGEFAFAVGANDEQRWREAEAIAATLAQKQLLNEPLPRAELSERVATRLDPVRSRLPLMPSAKMLIGLGAGAVLLVSGLVGARYYSEVQANDPANMKRTMAAAGFTGMAVTPDPASDNMVISGIVKNDAEVAGLQHLVDQRFPGAILEVETTDSLAAAAGDLLKAQGVDADAKTTKRAAIMVASEYLPADKQEQLSAMLKQELPGLKSVQFTMESDRGPNDLQYFFNKGPHGAATFVNGDPSYIATADGTKWMSGATLPTGHKIVRIEPKAVILERGGRIETLVM